MTQTNPSIDEEFDAIVIGGGFYGCCIAEYFKRQGLRRVVVLEQKADLMQCASYGNQARVHGGYHYPRSFLTARRSWRNLPRFVDDFRQSICDEFEQVYAVAGAGSKVSAQQFQTFCRHIGAGLKQAPERISRLFESRYIERAFIADEVAFDAAKLRDVMAMRLDEIGVEARCNTSVISVESNADDSLVVVCADDHQAGSRFKSRFVINCTYAGINQLLERSGLPVLPLKHELAEIALIEPPPALSKIGVTVIDGPFFSTMPFPARQLHSLTHVRYTPHTEWNRDDRCGGLQPAVLAIGTGGLQPARAGAATLETEPTTKYPYMLRDAARFLPVLSESHYVSSLFEMKTILCTNEVDDGRPILFRQHYGGMKNLYVVMGGKMDNVYDAIETFSRLGI
ncbi:MAG TPA: FAD-dependent oxidoreductase [Candidatus Obscuribacterales bacterium]